MYAAKPIANVLALCLLVAADPAAAKKASEIIDLTGRTRPQTHQKQISDQKTGDFGEIKRDATPAGQIQRAWDNSPSTAGVTTVDFTPSRSFRLVTRTMMVSTIQLPKTETIIGVDVPDAAYFHVEIRPPNKVGIIPSLAGLDMTIAVHTETGRTYPFYIRSTDWNATAIPDLLLRINLPGQITKLTPPPSPAPAADIEANDEEPRDDDDAPDEKPDFLKPAPYDPSTITGFEHVQMSGDKEIAPLVAWHDDRFSYFHFGDKFTSVDLPVVHRVRDGVDSPTNTRVAGTTLIAEEIAPVFTLQVGQKVVCVEFTDLGTVTKRKAKKRTKKTKTASNGARFRDSGVRE